MIVSCRTATVLALLLGTCCWAVATGPAVFAQPPRDAAAGQSDEPALGRLVRTRWILLDEENGLAGSIGTFDAVTGELNPASGLSIGLYDANASLVTQVTTGPRGRFRLPNLAGGLYQLIAQGNRGFLAFSLFAIERGQRTGHTNAGDPTILVQAPRQTEDRLDILSAAVPPTFTQLNSILRLYYGRTTPGYVGRNGASATANSGNGAAREPFAPENPAQDTAAIASAIRTHTVPLQNGNRIVGRLYVMNPDSGSPERIRDVYVHIIREDRLIGPPIPVNRDGVFEAELSEGPGRYSIVAAGSAGFGACSFFARRRSDADPAQQVSVALVSTRAAQRRPQNGILPRNAKQPYQFTMSLISDPRVLQQALTADAPPATLADTVGVALPAGGFEMTSPVAASMGSGVGGTGGGLGRALLFGGGLAAGITALAVDGGANGQQPASPFIP